LQSLKNKRYYIGSTSNISRRLEEHNAGESKYTNLTKPFDLVYFQKYDSLTKARQIEYKLKKLKSKIIIKKIIGEKYIKMDP